MQNGVKLVHELITRDNTLTTHHSSNFSHNSPLLKFGTIHNFSPYSKPEWTKHTQVHLDGWCIDEYIFFVCAYPYTNQGGEHMLIIFLLNTCPNLTYLLTFRPHAYAPKKPTLSPTYLPTHLLTLLAYLPTYLLAQLSTYALNPQQRKHGDHQWRYCNKLNRLFPTLPTSYPSR